MIFVIQTGDEVAGLEIANALSYAGIQHTIVSKQTEYLSVKCWKCESMFTPKAEDLKRWAESGQPFDPTDWECPSCEALEGEPPSDHSI